MHFLTNFFVGSKSDINILNWCFSIKWNHLKHIYREILLKKISTKIAKSMYSMYSYRDFAILVEIFLNKISLGTWFKWFHLIEKHRFSMFISNLDPKKKFVEKILYSEKSSKIKKMNKISLAKQKFRPGNRFSTQMSFTGVLRI